MADLLEDFDANARLPQDRESVASQGLTFNETPGLLSSVRSKLCEPDAPLALSTPLLLPDRSTLRGVSPGCTTLRWKWPGKPGALITNNDLDKNGNPPKSCWRHTGAHTMIGVRDVTLIGGHGVSSKPHETHADAEYQANGVHLLATGQEIRNVQVIDVAGWGVVVDRRPNKPILGTRSPYDRGKAVLEDVSVSRVLGGVKFGFADIVARNIAVHSCRDDGIVLSAAAQLHGCHVWGAGRGVVIPQIAYCTNLQAENIRSDALIIGAGARGTTICGVRTFACQRGIVLDGYATITAGMVEASQCCLDIHPDAKGTRFTGVLAPQGKECVAARVSAGRCHLDYRSWGGGDGLLIDQSVSDCRIVAELGGCQRGLVVEKLGYRNVIEVTVHKSVPTAVVLPDEVHSSNRIVVNGVER